MKCSLFFAYIIAVLSVILFLDKYINIGNAEIFDRYYSIILILFIALSSVFVKKQGLKNSLFFLVTISLILCGVATLKFYILSLKDKYFIFERYGNTWLGLAGFVGTSIYAIIGILLGVVFWKLKFIIKCKKF